MRMRDGSAAWAVVVASLVSLGAVGPAAAAEGIIAAVKQGDRAAVRALVQQRVDVNVAEPDGTRALHWAVRAGDRETVELLLGAGADAKAANRYGMTPLSLAATNGDAALLERLLKAGADPNTVLGEGETPLMTAARTGNPAAVKVLLAHGANVHATESWIGETALMWAAAEDHVAATQALIEAGAEINTRSRVLDTPKLKFPRSGGPNTPFPVGGWTPLMYAARQGALGTAQVLVEVGADLNVQDPDGTTALVLAIINAHYDLAALLVEKGANPNLADDTGMAALFAAVDMHTVQWTFGRPAPFLTDTRDAADLVKLLLEHGANPNAALTKPSRSRHHENPGQQGGPPGTTPLIRAAKSADAKVMKLLLQGGADPFVTLTDRSTTLMVAAGTTLRRGVPVEAPRIKVPTEADAIDCITLLLEYGVDINAFNEAGMTALHGSINRGKAVVKFVAEQGAKLDMKNRLGKTALDLAIEFTLRDDGTANRFVDRGESTVELLRQLMFRAASK